MNGVPRDRECLRQESERDCPLDGFLDAVARLSDAVGLGLLVGGLDRPAAVLAGDQLCGGRVGVGARERDVEPFDRSGVADQDHLHRPGVKRRVPEAGELVDVRGPFAAVWAGDRHGREHGVLGDLREAVKLGAFERRAALLAGSALGGRERINSRVGAHPARHAHPSRQSLPRLAGVRAVAHDLDDPSRETLEDHVDQDPRELWLGGSDRVQLGTRRVLRAEQPEQDRQPDLAATEARKLNDERDHDPAVPPPSPLPGPFRLRAVMKVVRAEHPPAGAAEQRVIDREPQRAVRLDEHRHQEVQQRDPDLVGIPACRAKKSCARL